MPKDCRSLREMGGISSIFEFSPRICMPEFFLFVFSFIKNSKSNSVPIILATVGLMLVTVVAGVLIVKKYVCGGR